MSSHLTQVGTLTMLALGLGLWLAGCEPNEAPTEPAGSGSPTADVAGGSAPQFGPFPGTPTIFVDVDNGTNVEDGSRAHPFNTIREALAAARSGDVVGVAPGVYTESFGPLTPNYVIDGLRDFTLLGSGAKRTTIRGDHSFSLIRVQNGASALIKGFTIEQGGRIPHSEGGGIQVLGRPTSSASLTVANVILQDNEAVNGAAISAEGPATLRLINVLIANNRSSNCCGVYLVGANGPVRATFKNTTITENSASYLTGGVWVVGARLNLVNSIVWGNSLAEVVKSTGEGYLSVSFSDIGETLFPGPGNLSSDPKFFDPASRQYHLRLVSPAVDAGSNTLVLPTDLLGRRRPLDGDGDGNAVVDMGAFERVAAPTAAGAVTSGP